MVSFIRSIPIERLYKPLCSLVRERCGVAIIEFALVLPVLLIILIGTVATFDALRAWILLSRATTSVVDSITRMSTIDDTRLDTLAAAAEAIMGRYAVGTNFTINIASIVNPFDPRSIQDLEADWRYSSRGPLTIDRRDFSRLSLPLIPESQSVIYIEVSNEYQPLLFDYFSTIIDYFDSQVRRPRLVGQIPFVP